MSEHFTFGDGSSLPTGWENAPMYNVDGPIRPLDGGFQVMDQTYFNGSSEPLATSAARAIESSDALASSPDRDALRYSLRSGRLAVAQQLADKVNMGEIHPKTVELLTQYALGNRAQQMAIDGCKSGDPIACTNVFIRRSLIEPFDAQDVARQVEGLSGGSVTCDAATLQCAAGTPRMSLASGLTLAVIVGGVAYAAYRFIRR